MCKCDGNGEKVQPSRISIGLDSIVWLSALWYPAEPWLRGAHDRAIIAAGWHEEEIPKLENMNTFYYDFTIFLGI